MPKWSPFFGDVLSPREIEVVQLYWRDFTTREIAEALGVALPTVKSHAARARRKLGVSAWGGLFVEAMKRGFIAPPGAS